ncbi:MAG TPA: hypothetical protein VFZ61_12415 [Polyangiales bacterium]
MRFSQRPLRASVIRVIAAFAPAVGCADTLEPEVVGNPPACSSSNTPGCVPTVSANDAGATTSDASVDPDIATNPPPCGGRDGPGCPPPGTADAGPGVDATTPPDATVVDTACPVKAPLLGSVCSTSETCYYEPNCGTRPTRMARCIAGRWDIAQSTCNPPPPVMCPSAEPAEGAGCMPAGENRCYYGSCDGGDAARTYQCTGNAWQLIERCGKPACPSAAPMNGTPCGYAGPSCRYGMAICGGDPELVATCSAGVWSTLKPTCLNPPPPECPGLAPAEGSSCALPPNYPCSFSLSAGGTVIGMCVEGQWKLGVADAGT